MPFPQLMGRPIDSFKGRILAALGLSCRKNDTKDKIFPRKKRFSHGSASPAPCGQPTKG